jgi:hypothetical protein
MAVHDAPRDEALRRSMRTRASDSQLQSASDSATSPELHRTIKHDALLSACSRKKLLVLNVRNLALARVIQIRDPFDHDRAVADNATNHDLCKISSGTVIFMLFVNPRFEPRINSPGA